MKVLEHGMYYIEKRTINCLCGCKFEYENGDIVLDKTMQLTSYPSQYKKFVICPECHSQTYI